MSGAGDMGPAEDFPSLDDPDMQRVADNAAERALVRYFAERKGPGDFLSFSWLYDALEIVDPRTVNDARDYEAARLRFLVAFGALQKRLLLDHKTALANVRGNGYRVVLPSEQTAWAESEMAQELRRSFSKGSARMRHVNYAALDASGRAANFDALARLAKIRSVVRAEERREHRRAAAGLEDGEVGQA